MIDDFLIRAFAAGFGVVLLAGPLGCFIVWRRMAYFGDSLAHSALLGVALGLILGINPTLGIAVDRQHVAYLFGDVLAVTPADLAWIYGGGLLALLVLAAIWRPLLAITVHDDLARAEGVAVLPVRLAFVLLIAVVIAIAMKIVGILLITSLLIIPAATARRFARTPEQMAALAVVAGTLAVAGGLGGSLAFDTPSGPSVVVAAFGLFLVSLAAGALWRPHGA
jgi:zinc transport system permease protein